MAFFNERLKSNPHLVPADVEWLHALVTDWQLLSDLAFSDLVLWFPHTPEGMVSSEGRSYVSIAQARPSTTQTLIHRDVVGDRIRADLRTMVERAWASQVETNSSDQGQPSPAPMRVTAIPLVRAGRTVGVITLHFSVGAMRTPSRLELTYRRCAGDLLPMVASGAWPDTAQEFTGYSGAPRVGDGLLRLDSEGTITFASPNAVSALLRLGVQDTVEGRSLAGIGAELQRATGVVVDESQPMLLTGRRAQRSELEAHGAAVTLRSIPLYQGAQRVGALVLCRDVTELRRREKQLMSKDATIKEIHHRVKNNLQTVSALLRMQSRRMDSEEGREGLTRAQRRVETIAMVHDSLSEGLEEMVDVDELIRRQLRLAAEMALATESGQSQRIAHTQLHGSFGQLPPDMVTPLALVITEIVANAVEHGPGASGADEQLNVELNVRRHDDAAGRQRLDIELTDDGVGVPAEGWEPGLGLQIVRTLVRGELSGSIEWKQRSPEAVRPGTRVVIRAPILS
ncbi:sensor histidine kinase [Garicola koreensis]|uniref:histidine kinase n=1 Tax=Garicola koreensis TaxID=1262554 RepID=A0A7W5XZR6_9MICC|nr:PAS domain-containing sensor histidine kinase [Garicola koreensis]MBB3667716.1 two-component sensor histidine kinase [Garicola koreensis]